tara:strand:- start:118 stop:516 length:399 start_codon:yes stop_codon:yes gene_type:complete
MGTRSLTYIKEKRDTQATLNMYKQFDGHPYAWGCELAEFLDSKKLTNGVGDREDMSKASGVACLIAQLISEKKKEVGGIYIFPVNNNNMGQEYEYHVEVCDDTGDIQIKIYDNYEKKFVFEGNPKELIKFYK